MARSALGICVWPTGIVPGRNPAYLTADVPGNHRTSATPWRRWDCPRMHRDTVVGATATLRIAALQHVTAARREGTGFRTASGTVKNKGSYKGSEA